MRDHPAPGWPSAMLSAPGRSPDPFRRGGSDIATQQVRSDRDIVPTAGGPRPPWPCQDGSVTAANITRQHDMGPRLTDENPTRCPSPANNPEIRPAGGLAQKTVFPSETPWTRPRSQKAPAWNWALQTVQTASL